MPGAAVTRRQVLNASIVPDGNEGGSQSLWRPGLVIPCEYEASFGWSAIRGGGGKPDKRDKLTHSNCASRAWLSCLSAFLSTVCDVLDSEKACSSLFRNTVIAD